MNFSIFLIVTIGVLAGLGTGLTDKSRYKLTYCEMMRKTADYREHRLDIKCYLNVDFFNDQVIKQKFKLKSFFIFIETNRLHHGQVIDNCSFEILFGSRC